jgi:hypothetical protein
MPLQAQAMSHHGMAVSLDKCIRIMQSTRRAPHSTCCGQDIGSTAMRAPPGVSMGQAANVVANSHAVAGIDDPGPWDQGSSCT